MRSSALSGGRRISRICDACRQHQRGVSISSSSRSPVTAHDAAPSRLSRTSTKSIGQPRWLSTQAPLRSATTGAQASPPSASEPATASTQQQFPRTHYDFFPQTLPRGPPPAGPFSIDVRELRREFLQLQGKAHPDLHPPHLKSRAEATSARINEAFKTLSSPLLRAQYLLLELRGLDVANDETAKVEDPELLMEVLEAREEIEEAADEGGLADLRARNAAREQESIAELERCFRDGDYEGAAQECVRLRYWVNIRESLDNWEPGKPVVLEH
ncbi:uncharacterized protein JN550_012255 [Neoarthrinium moseri]|uniref:uncharacterized protein n=1 Tax=Neoarthrinium moseri TaxID=1658444 RepID=UPI001FDBEF94|nr:uncharacterized protein JN550_012255 [Neoarthrinium moseri]KAI1858993.1 hypothetical protein JN550_012255 [Neoarthrinium moseri]